MTAKEAPAESLMNMARAERADLAEFLATLAPKDWQAPPLCSKWTVKDLVAHVISYASQFITLQPGDVIFTGTPSGVILGHPEGQRVWLKPGDRVRTRISKLGDLDFTLT